MNEAAAVLLQQGHTPLIGVNAALPVIEKAQPANVHEAIMRISLAVIDQCEALLMISDSPGADMERMLVLAKGLPVYYRIEDIPDARL